ncbi:hypothetical protein BGS_0930 [Beggiatoa sp. SS]|nr:hypothetical protein BGS_0930 [Beggiatoa sp. SS]
MRVDATCRGNPLWLPIFKILKWGLFWKPYNFFESGLSLW